MMPSRPDNRTSQREPVEIPCHFSSSRQETSGSCANMGIGGLGVITNTKLHTGSSLSVQYHLRDQGALLLPGEVVYCREAGRLTYALGIKFINLPQWQRDMLGNLLEEFKQNVTAQRQSRLVLQPRDTSDVKLAQMADRPETSLRKRSKALRQFTPDPPWVIDMDHDLTSYREQIWRSKLVQETSSGQLSLQQVRGWSIQFYPFIEAFPQFMATYLAKAPDSMSRAFLIDNLKVEKRHAEQWVDMANGFGVSLDELLNTPVIAEVETLTHWLWSITNRGSFVEAVSATNYAIEGVTQGIAKIMVKGFVKYHGQPGVNLNKKSYYWMEAHAHYDDLHPTEALEIMKQHATSPQLQRRVKHAAQRSLEYLSLALDACYRAYAVPGEPTYRPVGSGI